MSDVDKTQDSQTQGDTSADEQGVNDLGETQRLAAGHESLAAQAAAAGGYDPSKAILSVKDVGVDFQVDGEWVMASRNVSFDLYPGEVLAIVGESGSGKSVTAMGLLGLIAQNGRIHGSAILDGETELIDARPSVLRSVRGRKIGLIFQEPMTALNPVLTIGFQISEMLLSHMDMAPAEAKTRALELMNLVEIPDAEERYGNYPHQLSGGQRQRIVIAIALACDPLLLIADEPTTALDVTVQAEILDLMRDLHTRMNSAIILITHDMGVVADLADNAIVMRDGVIVEAAEIHQLFANPQTEYTKVLLDAVPHLGSEIAKARLTITERDEAGESAPSPAVPSDAQPALDIKNLVIEYPGRFQEPAFRAVDDVSFSIPKGEMLGLVGESGSGKTTIGRAVVGLLPSTSGEITLGGTNMVGLTNRQLRPLRRRFSIVFQDPAASLNPRMTIGGSIGEPIYLHEKLRRAELDKRVEDLLDAVSLPTAYRNRYPHELSGGQRQRVGIARALALGPELLVADEPTSALDVSVQAHVLEMFQTLQERYGFACLFISHDLAVVEILAKQIAVLHKGRLAEIGPREDILTKPQDAYTVRLLAAAPVPDPESQTARREDRARILVDESAADAQEAVTQAERAEAEAEALAAALDAGEKEVELVPGEGKVKLSRRQARKALGNARKRATRERNRAARLVGVAERKVATVLQNDESAKKALRDVGVGGPVSAGRSVKRGGSDS